MTASVKRPTIRDVAAIAGVSYGTVSRYLNGRTHVSQDAAGRIADAIRLTGYTPNNAARSLAQRRTGLVAFIVQVESSATLLQASVAEAMDGANRTVGDAGYQLVTLVADTPDSTRRIARLVGSDFADGYLLFSMSNDDSLSETFLTTQRPVVGSEVGSEDMPYPVVDFANRQGQRDMTALLLAQGRRNLAYVCGPGYSPTAINRFAGFREAMGDLFDSRNVYYADDWEMTSGELAVASFGDRMDSFDGLVCANDLIALGAMNQVRRMGIDVPGRLAVTGFDDSPAAQLARPKLTTVRQDSTLHGATMARLLLQELRGEPVESRETILPTQVVERQSS